MNPCYFRRARAARTGTRPQFARGPPTRATAWSRAGPGTREPPSERFRTLPLPSGFLLEELNRIHFCDLLSESAPGKGVRRSAANCPRPWPLSPDLSRSGRPQKYCDDQEQVNEPPNSVKCKHTQAHNTANTTANIKNMGSPFQALRLLPSHLRGAARFRASPLLGAYFSRWQSFAE